MNNLQNIFKGKRVFVTGHTGFKGSWLSLWLSHLGAEVAGYSIGIPSTPSHYEAATIEKLLAKNYTKDIRDFESLGRALKEFKPEILFHLAAEAIVRNCYRQPRVAFETNLMGTVNILDAMKDIPSLRSAVIITSDKCYENVEWEYGYRETDRLGGKDPYSASKACAEIAFHSFYRSYFLEVPSANFATARAGNVIGGGDWAADRIVPDCVRAWSAGKPVSIRAPRATRPWQHVLEPLAGYLLLASKLYQEEPGLRGESFNFGPAFATERSVLDLILEMKKTGTWKNTDYVVEKQEFELTKKMKEANLLRLCVDKVQARIGWSTKFDFSTTASFTSSWYSSFYQDADLLNVGLNQIKAYEKLVTGANAPQKKAA